MNLTLTDVYIAIVLGLTTLCTGREGIIKFSGGTKHRFRCR